MPTCWLSSERDVKLVGDHRGQCPTTTCVTVDKPRHGIAFSPPSGEPGDLRLTFLGS